MLKKSIIIAITLLGAFFYTGCATNPVTGENQFMLISPSEEEQIGKNYAPEVKKQLGGTIPNNQLQNYINYVGQKVASVSHLPDSGFEYAAVEDDMTNAMALPGGYIYITRGMLNLLETEDQLAAVLAHETAHVTARHSASLMSQQIGMDILFSAVTTEGTASAVQVARIGSQIIGLKYSRDYEKQADTIGMDYLVKAGYSPYAMVDVMQKLNSQSGQRPIEFLSTHPNPENRLELLRDKIARKNYPAIKRTPPEEYQKNVIDRLPPAPPKETQKQG